MTSATPKPEGVSEAIKWALRIGQSYVLDAMRNDGGIENCEIGYRTDFEAIRSALVMLSTAPAGDGVAGMVPTHRHLKSGHLVRVIGTGKMQSQDWYTFGTPVDRVDMHAVVIYEHDGNLWVRPIEEFNDGRFVALSASTAGGGK